MANMPPLIMKPAMPVSLSPPPEGEGDKVSLREFHVKSAYAPRGQFYRIIFKTTAYCGEHSMAWNEMDYAGYNVRTWREDSKHKYLHPKFNSQT